MLLTLRLALEGDLIRIGGADGVVMCKPVDSFSSRCQENVGDSVESMEGKVMAWAGISKQALKCSPSTLLYGLQTLPF